MVAATETPQMANAGVLLADASADTRATMAQAVRSVLPNASIVEAKTGVEALVAIRAGGIHAVIIDVSLPGMSGPDVLTEARREGKTPFPILTSAVVMPNWSTIATELGAYEFMKKPFMPDDLQNLIKSFARMQIPTRLMIADAGDHTRAMVRKVVKASRFRTTFEETDHGKHALKLARMQPFDMVLVDANLLGISGLEAACQMQSLYPDTMVVSILPSNDGGLGQSLKHLGLTQFLRKPFFTRDIDILMHTIHHLRRPYLMNAVMKANATAMAS